MSNPTDTPTPTTEVDPAEGSTPAADNPAPETPAPTTEAPKTEPAKAPEPPKTPAPKEDPVIEEGKESLGDPGKKALDAMKGQRNAALAEVSKANLRAASAVLETIATLKDFADASDAGEFLDASKFVSDDGSIDRAAMATAVDDLLKNKPYLAAQGKRFEGSADGGARESKPKRAQNLTDAVSARIDRQLNGNT